MIQSLSVFHHPLKLPKYHEIPIQSPRQERLISIRKEKINPIPILHIKLQNSPIMREKFVIHGYKYFSKVSAAGQSTPQVLKGIKRSQNLKYIRNFEFDPYLCDESYIGLLSQALARLKHTKIIKMFIRRLNESEDLSRLIPQVARLSRLYQFGIELPKTKNINDQAMMGIGEMLGKCFSVQVLDIATLNLENISESAHLNCSKNSKRLIKVRHMRRTMQKTEILNDSCFRKKNISPSIFRRIQVKSIHLNLGMPTSWVSMSTELDATSMLFLKALAWHLDLKSLSLRFTGNPIVLETLQILKETIPKIQSLRHFSLEFLNSRITESEMFEMVQMVPQLTHVEEFTFKVLQYPNVIEACILCLSSMLSKFPNFKKINLYFRRLSLDEYTMEEVVNKIQSFNGLSCVPGRNSLYIYKDSSLEA